MEATLELEVSVIEGRMNVSLGAEVMVVRVVLVLGTAVVDGEELLLELLLLVLLLDNLWGVG